MRATLACHALACQDEAMAWVLTNAGYSLGYEEAGGGEQTPIVFLHGVGSDKSAWRPQLRHFGRERRALAFDFPGYADSDAAPEGTTREDYGAAILSAMREIGVERAHICGLSLGGVVAIAMHHARRKACASLILADTFAVHPEGRAIYERSLAALENGTLRQMAEARVDVLLAQPVDPGLRAEVIDTMGRIDPAAYRIGAEAVWLADQRYRVAAIDVPTLVLVGDQDLVTPYDLSSELVDLIPDARLQTIPGAGHLSNLERPDEFNTAVAEFIGPLI
jgi:3-oxoadipate enol-lactonase